VAAAAIGADPDAGMRWPAYLRGVLAFSLTGVLLYALQRLQGVLPGSPGFASIDPDQAFNTAVSFVTNTNWQSYYGGIPRRPTRRRPGPGLRSRS
jgi:K+-transporting ATPase ATPase A chain